MFYNCLFVAEHLNQNLLSSFGGYLTYMVDRHNHNTRGAVKKLIDVPHSRTNFYGAQSIIAKLAKDWNSLQNQVAFNFNQEGTVFIPKLVSILKKTFFKILYRYLIYLLGLVSLMFFNVYI